MEPLGQWGIEPVPAEARRLGLWDYVVLWGDLGIGLLVLLAGSFLVPALSLSQALGAILLGSVIGVTLLALAGVPGSQTGVPTMVVLRPVLGIRGSYLPTVVNVLQLLGWTVFELVIMGHAANAVSKQLVGWDAYAFWVALWGVVVIGMAVWGPLAVVRQWLGRFAVWVMLATTLWLTWYLATRYDVGQLLAKPGAGGFPFWAAVDLVIAMPISWMPLVADYSRFARAPAPAFWGTALGYFLANVWFYGLGALILLAAGVTQEPKGFVEAIALIAGPLALLVLLVDETDEAWADLYSCAVSLNNMFPAVNQRGLLVGLGVFSSAVALLLDITRYEGFLLLIGSVFVPLFGVLASDYFVVRGRYDVNQLFRPGGLYWYRNGLHWPGLAAWVGGVFGYLWIAGKFAWLGLAGLPWLGASIPSFLLALAVYWVLVRLVPIRAGAVSGR
ncbi:MAG: cytosine permease [Candidatus Rokubacteria bacterium]|nr:cytosine permease [Candidatus Rokubacteria bacterium]